MLVDRKPDMLELSARRLGFLVGRRSRLDFVWGGNRRIHTSDFSLNCSRTDTQGETFERELHKQIHKTLISFTFRLCSKYAVIRAAGSIRIPGVLSPHALIHEAVTLL